MARLAILVFEGSLTSEHLSLSRILDFFGIPWKTLEVSELSDLEGGSPDHVLFGLAQTVAAALKQTQEASRSVLRPAAYYTYASDDRGASERGLQSLCGNSDVSLRRAPDGELVLQVSRELDDVAGPMAGLEVPLRLRSEDALLTGVPSEESGFATVISAGDDPVFVRFYQNGTPIFFCASSHMIDINESAGPGFYDVKDHFCSVVPLVMFVKFMFHNVAWRPQELGACLIIDDPLLKQRYGACDFSVLRDLMQQYRFTTNIAFIPWNWRRTSSAAGEFFRNESTRFSVSIHGCDHTRAEFGETSPAVLNNKSKLALSRMRNHDTRTGIHHDPVMVFPQGVFSSACPKVLKRNGFLAAVNTETGPADTANLGTQIRDVWDVAIMRYGDFPIFTRRYAHHGLENFAFDLMLGKPCLIVAHHDFFKDGYSRLIELIEGLRSLNCPLRWRPLGEVIRRACRRHVNSAGVEEFEMYGSELLIDNRSDQAISVIVRKRENETHLVAEVRCNQKSTTWTATNGHLVYGEEIEPASERLFQVVYREEEGTEKLNRSFQSDLMVAARRFLSEFRDDYLFRNRFLNMAVGTLKHAFRKAT